MEFSLKEISSFRRPEGAQRAGAGTGSAVGEDAPPPALPSLHHVLAMDPMHYQRKESVFAGRLPLLPSSWMEQWPVGKSTQPQHSRAWH